MSDPVVNKFEAKETSGSLPLDDAEQLLQTKLFIPPVRPGCVARPRLLEHLQGGLRRAVTLVSAPAGYGKTTLVSGWLHQSAIRAAWLTLDESDNDPIRFLQYFITVIGKFVPAIQISLMSVLQGMPLAPFQALLNILINKITESGEHFALVLDDFHHIHAQPVLEMTAYFVDHIPPQVHLVLISRSDPPFPLARLRAGDLLLEIRADHLRFTGDEIARFLSEGNGAELSDSDIAALEARTEGWIAGLQLASIALRSRLALQGGENVHQFVAAFTGSHSYVMDYLTQEVLALQPAPVRAFLLKTSILDRMCGPLCSALLPGEAAGPGGGQAMLYALEQSHLFVIPLDDGRCWYRYHHLFSDVLNRYLEQQFPQEIPELHRRASVWFEQNGYYYEAIHHSLQAGDQERAARLVDQNGCMLLMRGEVVNLLKWIEAVGPAGQDLPWIAIQKAWGLCLTGQIDRIDGPLQNARRIIAALEPGESVETMQGALIAADAFRANLQGKTQQATDLARQALDCLPVMTDFSCSLRSAATSILGDANWINGDLEGAQHAYQEAAQISQAVGNIHLTIIYSANLADILLKQGQLHRAARVYSDTLQMARTPDGQVSPLVERCYAGLGQIDYQWNVLDRAEEHLQQCLELSQRWASIEYQAVAQAMLAGLYTAQGRPEPARDALFAVERLIEAYAFSPWRSNWLKAALARGWLAQQNPAKAADLFPDLATTIDTLPAEAGLTNLSAPRTLTALRLRLADGEADAVLALSERLLHRLEGARRVELELEILILRALAFQQKADADQALGVLKRAFALARPGGYMRIFLDEGESMARLLYRARSDRQEMGYAAELLAALGKSPQPGLPLAQILIEPLTARELEVLKLIEAGCSNQDIAGRLVISLPTVKRHISNIYTKLGANSRTQAVARGKELELFP
jgi:LuxR family maltose regulon positive regulatory protein